MFYNIKRVHLICRIEQLLALKSYARRSCAAMCAVSRICEANDRVLLVHGSATQIEFSRDTLTFDYFRTRGRGSVVREQWCAIHKSSDNVQ
jgi:hypothetical protein